MVEEKYIDIVGTKALEALMEGSSQVFCRTTLVIDPFTHRPVGFGGDNDLVSFTGNE
ncbi:hypothetical protein SDC9_96302 [bioreactor metagenome]|uniref:Uncharacterized protein n=1 Tax=bioreactor metagenome TaxID=1076179 RepID=A0A645A8W8_9ZZZZ